MPAMAKVQLSGYRCDRCGHEWVPREKGQHPKVCPRCKSPYWDIPRQTAAKIAAAARKNAQNKT
jgi:predicted Zn-ribbon and HTH transcriptional regulator